MLRSNENKVRLSGLAISGKEFNHGRKRKQASSNWRKLHRSTFVVAQNIFSPVVSAQKVIDGDP
jgi:hypothetical protein